ncbi:hypothetical protein T459_02975 [Capsicum annuum]|uniref:Uncharacterized protein n=1 Tax=Capsicum annuum TaxID=4072 RepID=A0A2G3ALR8_CAPAN|nr:hypothetical protein T459_02975 [Capsicum annuum]
MFGTLVAQEEKATLSLDILISSMSIDFLDDVVMANMRNLPSNQPKVVVDEEPPLKLEIKSNLRQLSSLLTDIVSQSMQSDDTNIENIEESIPGPNFVAHKVKSSEVVAVSTFGLTEHEDGS